MKHMRAEDAAEDERREVRQQMDQLRHQARQQKSQVQAQKERAEKSEDRLEKLRNEKDELAKRYARVSRAYEQVHQRPRTSSITSRFSGVVGRESPAAHGRAESPAHLLSESAETPETATRYRSASGGGAVLNAASPMVTSPMILSAQLSVKSGDRTSSLNRGDAPSLMDDLASSAPTRDSPEEPAKEAQDETARETPEEPPRQLPTEADDEALLRAVVSDDEEESQEDHKRLMSEDGEPTGSEEMDSRVKPEESLMNELQFSLDESHYNEGEEEAQDLQQLGDGVLSPEPDAAPVSNLRLELDDMTVTDELALRSGSTIGSEFKFDTEELIAPRCRDGAAARSDGERA